MNDHFAQITIRRLNANDAAAVARLAARDSSPAPAGALLGAEVEGRLLAALSLTDGASIADPFSRTHEVRSLLELRASQLRRRDRQPRRRGEHSRPSRSHAALAGSVPGAGGRLLDLS
jgi:hypothetical protein